MSISDDVQQHLERKKAAMHALLLNWSGNLESHAKSHAGWVDRTGHARQSIHSGVDAAENELTLYLAHGMRYANFLETGTGIYGPKRRSFVILPKDKKALYWEGAAHPVQIVMNPGMKAKPIIGPTLETHFPRIKQTVLELWED